MSKTITNQTNRPDGRTGGSSLRPLACEISCLNRPDGSAKFSSGSTQVLSAIYGPAAPRQSSRENPSHAILTIVFKQSQHGENSSSTSSSHTQKNNNKGTGGVQMMTDREMERFIGEALAACICLEAYPRCAIEVVIQVMKADGSVVGTALNTAVVALLDAGIQMKSIPIATTCLLDWSAETKNCLKLDPVASEELDEDSSVVVLVTDSVHGEKGIISSVTTGPSNPDMFLSCISASAKASKAVVAFMRLAIEQKCNRESKTLWNI